jgi:DNA-binding CsgD family transcriptional regulator
LVEERTRQLAEVNQELRADIEKRKQGEMALEIKTRDLEEVNTALRVLLKQREDDRRELEEKICSNVKELVLRYVRMLRETKLEPNQSLLVDIIDRNLNDFLSPFCKRITSFDFTPKEMEVTLLTREGKTAKQMAQLLNVSTDAITRHRYHIRKKLGLNKNKRNLRSHLLSLC